MESVKMALLAVVLCAMVKESLQACAMCDTNCPTNDCIHHDITQQSVCTEVTNEAPLSSECQWWGYGLSRNTDFQMKKGRIIAYKIQWSNGAWSGWYVPEYNDHECKYNKNPPLSTCAGQTVCKNSLRRWWSYFYDHTHSYIICK